MIEMIVIALVLLFMIVYRKSNGDIRKYISENSGEATNKYKKYSFKAVRKKAKELGLDAIHDTIHEMCKDEARHGKAFLGLLERYFGEYKK